MLNLKLLVHHVTNRLYKVKLCLEIGEYASETYDSNKTVFDDITLERS